MGGLQHQHRAVMGGGTEDRRVFLGGLAPQQGGQRAIAPGGCVLQGGAGEKLPPVPGVGKGGPLFHRQHGVQQQYPLPGPGGQIIVRRSRAEFCFQFLENVFQAGGRFAAVRH